MALIINVRFKNNNSGNYSIYNIFAIYRILIKLKKGKYICV